MTVKERLHLLIEALPEEEAEQLKGQLEVSRKERSEECPQSFLQTYGGWANDPRTTEEILQDIYDGRALSMRDVHL